MIYVPYTAATQGMHSNNTHCMAMDGFLCEGPQVVTTFPPTAESMDRERREARDRRDLLDLLSLVQESIGYEYGQ